ncbi:SusC/RagA family TonB-linked outer membrane protein [Flavitalea flava]
MQKKWQLSAEQTKTLLVMKLTLLLLTTAILSSHASGIAQTVTLSGKNMPLQKVFSAIERQTAFVVFGNISALEHSVPVSVNVHNMPLTEFLNLVLSDQPMSYTIEGKTIMLSSRVSNGDSVNVPDITDAPPLPITGRITDSLGTPLSGATVTVRGKHGIAITDAEGRFTIQAAPGETILISYVGYEMGTYKVPRDPKAFLFALRPSAVQMKDVTVVFNTGYQVLSKERTTGSFAEVDNKLFNRRIGTDVLSRLEGVVPGLLFNTNTIRKESEGIDLSIRGLSTLYADDQPLVVVDNFPYDGDIKNLNPNDVESITVLKDAAAASVWGVRSGNGVIVITTKKGRQSQKLSVEFAGNVTIGDRPNLYYDSKIMPASDYVDLEQELFKRGIYDSKLSSPYFDPVTPVVQILADQRAGLISAEKAKSQIDAYRGYDVRQQLSKYFFQKSISQQYAMNLRGGGASSDYFFSLGLDNNRTNMTGNRSKRNTLSGSYNFYPLKNLVFSTKVYYVQNTLRNNDVASDLTNGQRALYPYEQFVDGSGHAMAVARDYSTHFSDSVSNNGVYQDWHYRPYDELNNADNVTTSTEARLNLGLKYTILKGLNAELNFQYQQMSAAINQNYSVASYYARDLINGYTQVDNNSNVTHPVPVGGILQLTNTERVARHFRGLLNYDRTWGDHQVTLLGGTEVSQDRYKDNTSRFYGYDKQTGNSFTNIDYSTPYPVTPRGYSQQVPNNPYGFSGTLDRYINYFGIAGYTYGKRYTVTYSVRKDKSNLFGVNTNQKGVPLYSIGGAWELNREKFFKIPWLPYLRVKGSYGYTANINKSSTAFTTLRLLGSSPYSGVPSMQVTSPGNSDLRWERSRIVNTGFEFGTKDKVLTGTVEYYFKKGLDLFGDASIAPSSGFTTFFGNTASIRGHGLDISLSSRNLSYKNFTWLTNLQLQTVSDVVAKYDVALNPSSYVYASASNLYPTTGRPIYALYSYRWAGLDHATGDPLGYVGKSVSKDYNTILYSTPFDSLVHNGSARPTLSGSFRNTFVYKGFTLSANLIYKFNYYFRRASYSPASLPDRFQADYYKRWQKPGDELHTNVMSFQYPPADYYRESFYANSSALVEKADHIRLQDVSLSYDLDKVQAKKMPFSHLQLNVYANNLGIIWRANHSHVDPDLAQTLTTALPVPKTYAFGIKANF